MIEWTTKIRGLDLINNALLNKGTGFSQEEREALGLTGLLPSHVSSPEEQVERMYSNIKRKQDPLEQHIGLVALQNRNEHLFYQLLHAHLEEFLPIVYTPTVGLACQKFSHIFRKTRGLWITPEHKGRIQQVLDNFPYGDVRLVVVTDNERILGLGDQGAGGMGIPVGKLSLYVAAAGIHPAKTLPVSLDVGTDNQALLDDSLYLGWRKPRLRGAEYAELVEEFVTALQSRFPNALLQWEDFKKQNAFDLLDRYRERLLSFNDDIQGTAGVAAAGILAACRVTRSKLEEQRVLILGAGAAGVGIGRLLRQMVTSAGADNETAISSVALVDSEGLLVDSRDYSEPYKESLAWPSVLAKKMNLRGLRSSDLRELIKRYRPTVLIGTTGQTGVFDQALIEVMAMQTARPVVMPFSNPTSTSEAVPKDVITWTKGKALVATGSPFDDVEYEGKTIHVRQGNNVYVFPGIGLGALVAGASYIHDDMFAAAATCLAELVREDELNQGALYPKQSSLREVTTKIACAVVKSAATCGVAEAIPENEIESRVRDFMWQPAYPTLKPI